MCIWYEQQVIDQWKPKYNLDLTAGSPLGRKHTKESKAKISASLMGNTYNLGNKHTKETRAKMSKARMGNNYATKKLTELDVYEIRRLHATGKVNQPVLAKMYKTDQGTISKIVNNKRWRHLL